MFTSFLITKHEEVSRCLTDSEISHIDMILLWVSVLFFFPSWNIRTDQNVPCHVASTFLLSGVFCFVFVFLTTSTLDFSSIWQKKMLLLFWFLELTVKPDLYRLCLKSQIFLSSFLLNANAAALVMAWSWTFYWNNKQLHQLTD